MFSHPMRHVHQVQHSPGYTSNNVLYCVTNVAQGFKLRQVLVSIMPYLNCFIYKIKPSTNAPTIQLLYQLFTSHSQLSKRMLQMEKTYRQMSPKSRTANYIFSSNYHPDIMIINSICTVSDNIVIE